MPDEVEQPERPPQPLDPPAVSAAGASPASRRQDCPTAARRPRRRPVAPRPRRPSGTAPDAPAGRRCRARRRSPRRRTSARPAPARTRAERAHSRENRTWSAKRAPRREPLPIGGPERLALAKIRNRCRRHRSPRIGQEPRPGRERRRATCTESGSDRAARAEAPATRSAPPRPASRRSGRPRARADRLEATLDEAERHLSAVARSCMSQPETSPPNHRSLFTHRASGYFRPDGSVEARPRPRPTIARALTVRPPGARLDERSNRTPSHPDLERARGQGQAAAARRHPVPDPRSRRRPLSRQALRWGHRNGRGRHLPRRPRSDPGCGSLQTPRDG